MVRERRNALTLTQEQLRQRLLQHGIDLSKTAMSRLEQGERPIRLNEVTALAQVLGIDLRLIGNPESRIYADERRADEEVVRRELAALEREVVQASNMFEAARGAAAHAEYAARKAHERLTKLQKHREALLEVVARVTRGDEEILDMIRIAKQARMEAERDGDS